MKTLLCCFIVLCFHLAAYSQYENISTSIQKQTFIYAIKDSNQLGLDVYTSRGNDSGIKKPCILFIFGGAFITGHRDDSIYYKYFNRMVENKYILVSISYRLGLRGVQHVSKYNTKPLKKAIEMAVEDVYDATNWIITNANRFGIDTSKIILSGSSSGAITALESDFFRRNETYAFNKLSPAFEYAGVLAFSGAILSFDWGLKYLKAPAPTLMFHGTADRIVPYNKISFLNKGFYGSAWIAKTFKGKNYPYYFYSEVGLGHEVAVLPMLHNIPAILEFIDQCIIHQKHYQTDLSFKNQDAKPQMLITSDELLKKLQ